ncbi:MAG: DUF190 domain-containing protein [Rhabdochlamydiaceae bacterium]|nr:DUF190 domain-containing protein [Candidatus Amphrikana amoebophyrae]
MKQELHLFVKEQDKKNHRPLFHYIIEEARKQGIEGASLFRTMECFGRDKKIHEEHLLEISAKHTIMIVAVSEPEKIAALIKELKLLDIKAFYTINNVETGYIS